MRYLATIFNFDNLPNRIDRVRIVRENEGWLLLAVRWGFFVFDTISPLILFKLVLGLRKRSTLWLTKRAFIEIYALLWFAGEIIILLVINHSSQPNWLILIFIVLVLWRLVDILQSSFRLSFLRLKPTVIPARSLILILLNYAEIIMIFAVVYFIKQNHFNPPFEYVQNSLEYSISVFVPFIGVDINVSPHILWGKVIFYGQITSSILLHLVIIQRVLSYFRGGNN